MNELTWLTLGFFLGMLFTYLIDLHYYHQIKKIWLEIIDSYQKSNKELLDLFLKEDK